MQERSRGVDRRRFLSVVGTGAASLGASLAVADAAGAEPSTEVEKANIEVVNRFLHIRWNATPIDYAALRQLLSENCVRGGADPRKLETGRDTILKNLKERAGEGVPTRFTYVVRQWACGPMVMHERYEGSGVGRNDRPPSIGRGVGVFQVEDGKITEWRWFGTENGPGLKIPAGAFKP
jgi:limonene-1,2-epoxide hydrolase